MDNNKKVTDNLADTDSTILSENQHTKISVIIPIYNAEKFISKTINSILIQEDPNLEIILVNDGSSDQSGYICNQLSEELAGIKVIHKKNTGVSATRNLGLTYANGAWVYFMDADDYLSEGLFKEFRESEKRNSFDLFHFGFRRVRDGEIFYEQKSNISGLLMRNDFIKSHLKLPFTHCFYFVKRSILLENNFLFPEDIKFGEDTAFSLKLLLGCKKVYFTDKIYYNYYYNPNSATNSSFSINVVKDIFAYLRNVIEFLIMSKNESIFNKELTAGLNFFFVELSKIKDKNFIRESNALYKDFYKANRDANFINENYVFKVAYCDIRIPIFFLKLKKYIK